MTDLPARPMLNELSAETLASVLDQSVDCVKLIGLDRSVRYMNGNGLCAMEIDDFSLVEGAQWSSLWPAEARDRIDAACDAALGGETARLEAFCPTAKGTPRWWSVTVSPVRDARGKISGLLSISRDVSETRAAHEALEIAAAELRHRLSNAYQIVVSLITGFAQGDPANEAFARDMARRLTALGKAQATLADDGQPSDVSQLLPSLVAPFTSPICDIAIAAIEPVTVEHGQADAIALVMGELSVNSAKHGAMKHGGRIDIAATTRDGILSIAWTEDANKPVAAHSRAGGQGLKLVERIVTARGGDLDFSWGEFGPRVELRVAVS